MNIDKNKRRSDIDISTTIDNEGSKITSFLNQYNNLKYKFLEKKLGELRELIKTLLDQRKEELDQRYNDSLLNEIIAEGLIDMQERLTTMVDNLHIEDTFKFSTVC